MKGKQPKSPRSRGSARQQWTPEDSRRIKRDKKRKGFKAGSRHAMETDAGKSASAKGAKDPRIGSKKRVPLTVSAKPVEKNVLPARQPKIRIAKPAAPAKPANPARLQAELARLENDDRLNTLLDKVDAGIHLDAVDQAWLDKQLARHEELMQLLGLNDEPATDDGDETGDGDDLLKRFERNDFDSRDY